MGCYSGQSGLRFCNATRAMNKANDHYFLQNFLFSPKKTQVS